MSPSFCNGEHFIIGIPFVFFTDVLCLCVYNAHESCYKEVKKHSISLEVACGRVYISCTKTTSLQLHQVLPTGDGVFLLVTGIRQCRQIEERKSDITIYIYFLILFSYGCMIYSCLYHVVCFLKTKNNNNNNRKLRKIKLC
jgi:hypothetical protein